jgi:quinol monooxygenase YgiN
MELGRRDFLLGLTGTAWIGGTTVEVCQGASAMYGLIAKLTAASGKRDELMTILIGGTRDMPRCFSYIVAKDSADENVVWVTETWDSQASQDASLTMPAVKNSITQAKPLIAGFEKVATTTPVGGVGLPRKSGL